jgi:hypothetical protein
MKIYKSNYRDHWISPYTVLEYVFFWTAWSKCGRNRGVIEDKDYVDHPPWVERATDYIKPACQAIKWVLDLVHPQINYIRIDRYDTWSMDHTLADIILPMLKQLNATKHGAPHVDDADVPEYLRSHMAQPKEHEWDTDSLWHMRWDWVLAEMIWAFEQKVKDDAEGQFFDHSAPIKTTMFPSKSGWPTLTIGQARSSMMKQGIKYGWHARPMVSACLENILRRSGTDGQVQIKKQRCRW